MVIFAAFAAAFGSLLAAAQVAITIASLLYQRQRQKKLEKEADKQKGFDLAIDGDPIHLPLVYGTQKIGGVRTFHQTYTSIATDTDNDSDGWTRYRFPENRWTPAQDNSHNSDHANSYLVIQQALCFGGIDSIVDVEVNSQNWNARNFWHLIEVHKDGGSANPSAVATGIPATNKFTNTAWLHASFWLNRDNFNYSGVPNVSVYVKGQKVWTLKNTGGVIQLDQKIYSNNNSYVLMDYLLRPKNLGGVGLGGLTVEQWLAGDMPDTTRINLTSFFNAANICATVVESNVKVKGRINGIPAVDRTVETLAERGNGKFDGEYISVTADDTIWRWQKGALISPAVFKGLGEGREEVSPAVYAPSVWIEITSTRDIHLYECNITIDTERSFRDNIELLLETMGGSELIFAEGKYKLLLDYPEDQTEQDNLVVATYTDADIVSEDVTVSYPGASDRYNRVVVKFNNEEKDFSTDSVSFPAYLDANHQKMLAEDNGVESTQEIFLPGVSIKELAAAKAETMVRQSRLYVGDATVDPATAFSLNQKIISLTLDRKAIVLETGDLFKLDSDMTDIHGDVFKVETIRFTPQLNVEVTASQFNYTNLAYSEKTLDVPNPRKAIESVVPNVTNLAYNVGRRTGGPVNSNGYLSWTAPATGDVVSYEVWEFIEGGNWTKIGDANGTFFDVPASSDNGGDRYYSVKVKERGGKLSIGSVLFVDTLASVTPIGTVNVAQFAGGVTLDWDDSVDFLVRHYDVYWSATNTKPAEPNTSTKESFFTLQPIPSDTITYVWIDVVGFGGTVGEMLVPVEVQAGALAIDNEDLQGIIDATSFAAGIEPVTVVTSLPTVKATELVAFAGKLYRWNGTAYVATVPANDVTGQLTNEQIADIAAAKITGTITAPQIANGAVTDAKIAGMAASKVTGQLNDIQIAAVSAAKLTGQIVSSQIADAALTTSKFASGIRPVEIVSSLPTTGNFAGRTVFLTTDSKLYRHTGSPTGSAGFIATTPAADITGQITAGQIATGAITAGKIAAGVISATEIASGTITASKLSIGDFTNLIPDAGLMDVASWTLGSGFSLADSDGAFETTSRKLIWDGPAATGTPGATAAAADSDFFVIDSKREYVIGGMFRSNTSGMSGRAFSAILWYDVNKTYIGANFPPEHTLINSQQKYSAIYTPPAGAVFARFTARRIFDASGNVSGPCVWYHNFVRPAAAGELIVDGAITASKVAASAITADKIAASTITGDKIAANTITAAKITSGTITSAQIAAGTIQASNIAADTITGDKIAASTITASEIATGAITAVKIASATITADKIVGSTITGDKIAANTITAAKIAAGTITAAEIAGSTITGDKIVANTIDTAQIATGAIKAAQINAGAVTAGKIAIGSFDNLNVDADFTDPTAWSGSVTWQASNNSVSWGSTNVARLAGGSTSYTVATSKFIFDVDTAGEKIFFRYFAHIIAGSGSVYADLQINTKPDFSGTNLYRNIGLVTSTSITEMSGVIDVPAGYRYARIRLIKNNDGTTDCFIGGVYARRMNGGKLIVDGSIQSNHVDTGSFSASGLALFGGNIQSSNFSTGSAGWKINQTGDAEFNSLIVRSSLVDGAVSDGGVAYAIAAQHKAHNSTVTSVSVGSNVTPDTIYNVALYFEHRDVWDAPTEPVIASRGLLQQRVRTGSTWGAWTTIYTSDYGFTRDLWVPRNFITNLILKNDGVEFKLVLQNSAGIVIPSNQKTNVREASISVRALRR